jgi:hypothetical protein
VPDRVDVHCAAVEAHGVEAASVTASTSRPEGARTVIAAALDTYSPDAPATRGGYFSSGAILVQTVWMCLATAFSGMPPIEAQKYTVSTGASPTLSRTRRATCSGVP